MNAKTAIRKTLLGAGIGLLTILLCVLLVYGLMQTDLGREKTARLVERALSQGPRSRVEISGLEGRLPFEVRIDRLSWKDREGEWLTARDVAVDLSPRDLLEGIIRIESLRVSALDIQRPPQQEDEAPSPSRWPPPWLAVLEHVRAENLLVERLSLGERLLGEAAVFRVQGRLQASPRAREATAAVTRLDREGTSFEGRALLEDRRLTLDVRALDRRDFLASLIGLAGPLRVSLQGEGALDHWEGSLTAASETYGELESGVTLKAGEDFTVKALGVLRLRPENLPPPLSPWTRGETPFLLSAAVAKESLTVHRFALNREGLDFTLSGSVDLGRGTADGRFELSSELEPLSRIIHRRAGGTLLVEGRFSGVLPRPDLEADVKIEHLALDDATLSSLQGAVQWTFPDQGGGPHRVIGKGDMQGLSIRPFYEERARWAFELAGLHESRVEIREMEVVGKGAALRAKGSLDLTGPLSLDLHLNGRWSPPPSLTPGPLPVEAVAYEGRATLVGNEIKVSQARLEASNATLLGSGALDLSEKTLSASWDLEVSRLRDFGPALGFPMDGSVRIQGRTEGSLDRPTTRMEAKAEGLMVHGFAAEIAEANLLARGMPPDAEGQVSLSLLRSEGRVESRADFSLNPEKILFSPFRLDGPETTLGGHLEVALQTGRLAGRLKGRCGDLSALSPWIGETMKGEAVVNADFVLHPTGSRVSLDLEAGNLTSKYGNARRVRIETRLEGSMTAPDGHLNLDLTEARIEGWTLTSSSIRMKGNPGEARFQASLKGHGAHAFELRGSGSLSFQARSATWQALQGVYRQTSFSLASPVSLQIGPETFSVRGLSLHYGKALIQGAGHLKPGELDGRLKIHDLALGDIPSPLVASLSGTLSAELALHGTPAVPGAGLAIRVSGLKLEEESLTGFPPVLMEGSAEFKGRRLEGTFSFEGLASEPFEGRFALPLRFSLSPFLFAVPAQEPLDGSFSGAMRLERAAGLMGLDRQTVGGRGYMEVRLEGTAEAPEISGRFEWSDGNYENLRTGTLLSRVRLHLSATAARLKILEARASDGEEGTVSADGWLDLTPAQGFPLSVELRLDRAAVLRHDEATATVSGTLSLDGSLQEAALSGRIRVDSADFRIPDRLPDSIAEVEVIEINKKAQGAPPLQDREKKEFSWPLKLDVGVESTGRCFLRGRGLDTEWGGQLRVSGQASKPSITGTVSVVRGRADFLGRSFDVRQGTISFSGNTPPSPFIDMTAEAAAKDVTARLGITGVLPAPDIRLSAQPPLPQDEILARLLFGRSARTLSPIQALQLADALNTLSGGGMDLMGRSRRLLGVDQLAVKSTGDKLEDTALSAGKYLSEDVYVEVEKGISPETGKASLKWDVTPNVTLDTEVGINAEAGVGVQWKWDY